ncbi:hypothetical protein [Bradyrhizobium sp. CCBAU 53421]|uniref:hypothetical protein n=1 Tax=Bradyrhizobium sp. CCBAU 53421 TaxID=1325120 RepID=UPI00188B2955|nr:hypothetical protein [Bradyrhizobium sp. CCBAU 53421]QOZ33106.1 hypothetical protein XH92_16710 [Bradyrhizobium sp. CCBAU 53421]
MTRNSLIAFAAVVAFGVAALGSAQAGRLPMAPPKMVGAKLPPGGSGGPHRQPVDPPPYLGTDYSGDSAGGSGGGGYLGDPNHPGHEQF